MTVHSHARVNFYAVRKTDRQVVNSCEASSRLDQFKYFKKVKTTELACSGSLNSEVFPIEITQVMQYNI